MTLATLKKQLESLIGKTPVQSLEDGLEDAIFDCPMFEDYIAGEPSSWLEGIYEAFCHSLDFITFIREDIVKEAFPMIVHYIAKYSIKMNRESEDSDRLYDDSDDTANLAKIQDYITKQFLYDRLTGK